MHLHNNKILITIDESIESSCGDKSQYTVQSEEELTVMRWRHVLWLIAHMSLIVSYLQLTIYSNMITSEKEPFLAALLLNMISS